MIRHTGGSRRLRPVRAVTLSVKGTRLRDLEQERVHLAMVGAPDPDEERPRTRGDCASVPRPCPFAGCPHHLYLDVDEDTGSIKLNFPDLMIDELPPGESCSLDVAEQGGETLERCGDLMNITRERIRQLEAKGLRKFKARSPKGLETYLLSDKPENPWAAVQGSGGATDPDLEPEVATGSSGRHLEFDALEAECEKVYAIYERRIGVRAKTTNEGEDDAKELGRLLPRDREAGGDALDV